MDHVPDNCEIFFDEDGSRTPARIVRMIFNQADTKNISLQRDMQRLIAKFRPFSIPKYQAELDDLLVEVNNWDVEDESDGEEIDR